MRYLKQLLYVFALLLSTWSAAALAAPSNGLWTTSTGDYFLLMQDSAKGQAIAVQIASDLNSVSVYAGTVSGDSLSLKKLDQSSTLYATATGSTMSGTYLQSTGASDLFSADLSLAYAGSAYDGIWQKTGASAYLAYLTMTVQDKPIALVLELTANADGTLGYDVITGTAASEVFLGISAMNGRTLKLTFSGADASGIYVTTSRQTTTFTATQIFKVN